MKQVLVAAWLAGVLACGARPERGGEADLRLAVVERPGDARAHARLGEHLARRGLPGAAIRELRIAHGHGDGSADATLVALLAARARERDALGDLAAWRDWEEALAVDKRLAGDRVAIALATAVERTALARRAAGDEAGARLLLARMPHGVATQPQPSLGAPCHDDADALATVIRMIPRDAAVAARLARDYADAEPALLCRGPALVAAYLEARDPTRALAWAEEILAQSPDDPGVARSAALAATRLHDVARADLYREQVEFSTAEHGGRVRDASRDLADMYLSERETLAALSAARRVLMLSSTPEERLDGAELVAAAQLAAGRPDEARALLVPFWRDLGPDERVASAARVGSHLPGGTADALLAPATPAR